MLKIARNVDPSNFLFSLPNSQKSHGMRCELYGDEDTLHFQGDESPAVPGVD
jgi:hypothetical protein